MAAFAPLNPVLYRRLCRAFGSVKVSKPGIATQIHGVTVTGESTRHTFVTKGEYYAINCPACRDTRHRLYVNHAFGQIGPLGRPMYFLATCMNEHCLAKAEHFDDFLERLTGSVPLDQLKIAEGRAIPINAPVEMPGPWNLLSELEPRHEARTYLEGRGFDPDELSARYSIGYCHDSVYLFAGRRIVIPVFRRKTLVGWQARYVGDLAWKDKSQKRNLPPKFFSCPNSHFRSAAIYNFHEMSRWETGVVVEGPGDVWGFGGPSGGIFGNTVTELQKKILLGAFRRDRQLVFLIDPDQRETEATRRTIEEFSNAMPGRFAAVWLPEGSDPGSLDRRFAREFVRAEAAARGVIVRYRRVDSASEEDHDREPEPTAAESPIDRRGAGQAAPAGNRGNRRARRRLAP